MNKEQLEKLGLNEEQIKEVFKLNGIAINNAKGDLDTRETELADTKKLLEDANKEIEGFKGMDVEGIKQAAEDYRLKFEDAEKKSQEQLETVKFNHELEAMARDYKAKNTKAVLALLDKESLKESKNRKEDIKKAFESMAEENGFLFDVEEVKDDGKPKFTRPNGTGSDLSITKEQFKSMGYKEKSDIYDKDIDLYKKLSE